MLYFRLALQPVRRGDQPRGEETDVKTQVAGHCIGGFLWPREQIEQQGSQAGLANGFGDELIARTVAARTAAMREGDSANGSFRDDQFAFEPDFAGWDVNFARTYWVDILFAHHHLTFSTR